MKSKKIDKRKTLAYAVAFYFTDASVKFMMGNTMYEYVHTVYDRRYDNGGFNTLAIVYNYKRMKYEALVVSDEKVGDKEIQILYISFTNWAFPLQNGLQDEKVIGLYGCIQLH